MSIRLMKYAPLNMPLLLRLPALLIAAAFLSFWGSTELLAQDFDNYQPMRSRGEIPAELLQRSSEKYIEEVENLASANDKVIRGSQRKFLLQNSFLIDELLLSGKALFNDPLASYLNRVKDHLLRDHPDLREQIRIYTVRSPAVNAFATNNGIILFNLGLFARLENEAQLAFILCHEFQHYIHQHPINQYVFTDRLSKQRVFSPGDLEGMLLTRNQYSRELETEADEKGLELFRESGYALSAVNEVFDILARARFPFADREWTGDFFARPNLRFPPGHHLDSVAPIVLNEDYDDSESTHPNIAFRRESAEQLLAGADMQSGKTYSVDEAAFAQLRKMALFEVAQLYLEQRRYEEAIYHAHLLLQDDPESFFLQKVVAYAIYGMARHKNARNFFQVHTDYDEVKGEAQRLHYFFGEMQKAELNVLAIDWCWRVHKAHPEDREMAAICKDLLKDLFRYHRDVAESMSDLSAPEGFFNRWDSVVVVGEETPEETDTQRGILQVPSRNLPPVEAEEWMQVDYFQHAFAEFFANPEFSLAYHNMMVADPEVNDEALLSPRQRRRASRRKALKGETLGIEKVVFVAPRYKKIDERKEVVNEFLASEKAQGDFLGMIRETADAAGLQHDILSSQELEQTDTDRFNDLATMEQWIAQYMQMWEQDDIKMVNLYADEAREVAGKYGANHFAYTGVVVLTRKKSPLTVAGLVVSGALIITLPVVIYALVRPRRVVLYLNLVFDVEENEIELEEGRRLKVSPFRYIIKSQLYSSMHQMMLK